MEDLIRRSDAIKGAKRLHNLFSSPFYNRGRVEMIEAYFNDIPSAESTGDLDNAIYEYVKEGLMANPYDRPQEWIPCSERLPSENGDYLVTLENGVVKILGYSTTQRTTYPKGFYHIEDGFSWRQIQNPVVAWMPLPKPWKGEDDDNL